MYKRTAVLFLFLLAFALTGAEFFLDAAKGDDKNPGSKTAPWKTLQLNKVSPGDKVFFLPGVYPAQRFKCSGTPDKPVTFTGIGRVVLDGGAKSNAALISGAHLRFENMTFRNSLKVCVLVSQCRNVAFDKLFVEGAPMGFWISHSESVRITNSDIEDVEDGIFIDCSRKTTVANNRIGKRSRGRRDGICVYAPGSLAVAAGSVKNVRIISPGRAILEDAGVVEKRNVPFKGFHTIRSGGLRGNGDEGDSAVLLYEKSILNKGETWDLGEDPIPGGKGYFGDERSWFRLVNNPEWNNKPYSPDGRKLMFDPGKATPQQLANARFAMVAFVHPFTKARTVDTLIENNIIDGCGRQGIRTQRAFNTLIRNNTVINCGASGIQLESTSFNTLVTGNIIKDHNRNYNNETGIWIHENADALIENNRISGCQKGVGLTQSYRCIFRFNLVENNRAQNIQKKNSHLTRRNVNAIYLTGGNYRKVGLTPGCADNAIVCNTFRNNGLPESLYGVFAFAFPILSSPPVGNNIFAHNTISGDNGKILVSWFKDPQLRIFGNKWPQGDYLVNIENKQKVPFKEWIKFEKMRPLAVTTAAGKGNILPVDNPEIFYAGFAFSDGRKVTQGDKILAGSAPARVVKVDIPGKKIHVDKNLVWQKNAAVSYCVDPHF